MHESLEISQQNFREESSVRKIIQMSPWDFLQGYISNKEPRKLSDCQYEDLITVEKKKNETVYSP